MIRYRPMRGFTLVEVLVALVIVAFGMGAVLAALTSAADNTARLRDKSLAEWIGFNQISAVRLALQQPSNGSSDGEVEFAGENWHWQQQIDELDIPGVKRITVKVRRNAANQAAAADDAVEWLATTVGFRGDAIASASGEVPDWNGTAFNADASGADGGGAAGDEARPPGEGARGGGSRSGGPPGGRPPADSAEPPPAEGT